jgi:hypothetical protein
VEFEIRAPRVDAAEPEGVRALSMSKGEREDLQRLVRQREKAQKSAARLRTTELLADFESQMAAQYSFDDDATWAEATKVAQAAVEKAQADIEERCRALGIPKQFAPALGVSWRNRGYDNAIERRRNELRRAAKAQAEALEQRALVQIETSSVDAQTKLALAGLTSDGAREFVESLPTVESLMPKLSYQALAGEAEVPLVEQLLTPSAFRHRIGDKLAANEVYAVLTAAEKAKQGA